ncbi:hypothetical protein [Desulfobulbus alkaliphilus]|uniref:hypothetical protein n=1 Tax=Desulfobulbus alkaliphilus TaxID=869814 RepID=UPI0019662F3C|nr:hypothetical protein [Desulfobulbus alkaliphilus]MBM9535490.1 hypothetical protein [Desulfobulbus alkaliphilus]
MDQINETIEAFLRDWQDDTEGARAGFIRMKDLLAARAGVEFEFHPRPGLTYSLRATHPESNRPLLLMIDVIEDQPRWLSVCFFADMIEDPEERGAFVPGGLLGEDALCFDLETCSEHQLGYVEARIMEACQSAAEG